MGVANSRWPAIAGIVFVVLLIVGLVLIADIPDASESDQEIADYLADSDKHVLNIVGLYLWTLAGASFLWFVASLRGALRQAEGEPGTLSGLAFGAGVVFTALLMASGAAIAAVAGAIELGESTDPAPDFVRMLPQLGFGMLLIGGGFAAIVLVLSTSILALQTGVLPRWLAWLGFAAAVVLLFSFVFIPLIALPIWVLAVSVVWLTRGGEGQTATA